MTDRRYLQPLRYGPRKREYVLAALALSLALFAAYGGDRPEDRVLEPLAVTMPRALGFEEPHRLLLLTAPVRCARLPGVEDMGREWLRSWGDGALPPAVPTCVRAVHNKRGSHGQEAKP